MADETDILLQFWQDRRAQARQSEDQRATLTNLVLLIEAAGLGVVASQGLNTDMLAITIPLIVLGVYGAVGSLKLYERHQLHAAEAREIAKQLDARHPDLCVREALQAAKSVHREHHKRLIRVRLHDVWAFLHLAVASVGVLLTVAILR